MTRDLQSGVGRKSEAYSARAGHQQSSRKTTTFLSRLRAVVVACRRNALRFSALRTAIIAAAAMLLAVPAEVRAADPDALWKIVHDGCVPNEQQHRDPTPCALVDLHGGVANGYVLLKDIRGRTQYLAIPTARVTGIEDPQLLAPDAPNYFADAWAGRSYTARAVGHALPRDALSLAVNSPYARSQNQLHIHVDCLRPDVRAALRREAPAIGGHWAPLPTPLAGHRYWAMRVFGNELGAANPFKLLADGKPGAGAAMREQTLAVVGADFAGGRPGFLLLDDRLNLATGDHAGGEELQDHTCALARE
jgi:CDP-diacylglycerol pyrophosphatase